MGELGPGPGAGGLQVLAFNQTIRARVQAIQY
jgi:hypothetical protein